MKPEKSLRLLLSDETLRGGTREPIEAVVTGQ